MALSGFQFVNKEWQVITANMDSSWKILKEVNAGKTSEKQHWLQLLYKTLLYIL